MKIPAVKGTRDFYPQQMAVRNFIIDGWKRASIRNGFVEYDGPILEYMQMYQIKSGQEIVEQLFHLTDRGGRELAIRPEITPTLARMINQQVNTLPRPIRWFSVPRLCRAEKPQKGRLREFFQWNIDIVGAEDMLADAEVIFCALDYLRSVGLTARDVAAKISSRRLLAAILKYLGIREEQLPDIYPILDKKTKLPADTFAHLLHQAVGDAQVEQKILQLMELQDARHIPDVVGSLSDQPEASTALAELDRIFWALSAMGVGDFCRFDMSIVRGLAYYTGMVFEIHDIGGQLRAVCGGGRYDRLLEDFGGPALSAVGMGMGDCVLEILLRERGLLFEEQFKRTLDYYVIYTDAPLLAEVLRIVGQLRAKGRSVEFAYKSGSVGKMLKQADAAGAKQCLIVGGEYMADKKIVCKRMDDGSQSLITEEQL